MISISNPAHSRIYKIFLMLLFVASASIVFSFANYSIAEDPPANVNTQPQGSVNVNEQPTKPVAKPQQTFTLSNPLRVNSIGGLVKNFVDIFSVIVIILAVLTLIYVGLQFILARGDVAKMKELKEWLLWIVVGIAVVISARLIVDIVINTLSASGTVDKNTLNSVKDVITK